MWKKLYGMSSIKSRQIHRVMQVDPAKIIAKE